VKGGRSLTQAMAPLEALPPQERGLARALCFDSLRFWPYFEGILRLLLKKPLKDDALHTLLILGLCQLERLRIPAYAAVGESVSLARRSGRGWAAGLVNAVLRNFLRQREAFIGRLDEAARLAHPPWLLERIQKAWPRHWQAILEANNGHPPMALRVNASRLSSAAYLEKSGLPASPLPGVESALLLEEPMEAQNLPGFAGGEVSVQDGGAQLAAFLLNPQAGERILDACAAPGGKACHILEREPRCRLLALDRSPGRLSHLCEDLGRLGLSAQVMAADAACPETWWDGEPFDAILLDAPCSATGVIRRHPDIKLHRRPGDIPPLVRQQRELLEGLWPLLKKGGRLLYATCSLLPEENEGVMEAFLKGKDAGLPPMEGVGLPRPIGRQILPGATDGFYYALVEKR
ncbi:MAG: 16S rRNA (cytosine(967)-C(5))-methyltransferase RsmB, partial [Gammaproteobacteria bacterium]